jgi:hypothetical protein
MQFVCSRPFVLPTGINCKCSEGEDWACPDSVDTKNSPVFYIYDTGEV